MFAGAEPPRNATFKGPILAARNATNALVLGLATLQGLGAIPLSLQKSSETVRMGGKEGHERTVVEMTHGERRRIMDATEI